MKHISHFLLVLIAAGLCSCSSNDITAPSPTVDYSQIDFDAAWSSSGGQIAYSHNDLEFDLTGIYTIDSTGNNKVQRVTGNASNPGWSPLDTAIIYEQGGAIMILNLATGINRIFTSGNEAGKPSWNKVNGKIAFSTGELLYVTDTEGSTFIVVNVNCSWSDWSPDGRYLYYFQPLYLSGGIRGGDAMVRFDLQDLSNTIMTNLTSDTYLDHSHISASDTVVYYSSTSKDGSSHIYAYYLNTGIEVKIVSELSYSPSIEPSQNRLLYTNRKVGDGRLWILESDGLKRKMTY